MTTYVFRDGHFRDKKTGERMPVPDRGEICAPMVISDIPPHVGPSGRLITSRSEQREEWKRTGTCAWEPLDNRPRGLSDSKIAAKAGKRVDEATVEWLSKKQKAIADGTYLPPSKIDTETKSRVRKAQAEVLAKHGVS